MDDRDGDLPPTVMLSRMRPTEEILIRRLLLPLDRGFTARQAADVGVGQKRLKRLVDEGLVRPLVYGAYAVADLELTVLVRARAISLVVPPKTVVTDHTAAWLHGADLLDHRGGPPPLSFVRVHGATRLRREGVTSGTRMFVPGDITTVYGVRATTPLRTAIDLARRPGPAQALGALDGLLRTGTFTTTDIEYELARFKGFRGVVQLRTLVPIADARAESPAESRVRWQWLCCTELPRPDVQIELENPRSDRPWFFDLGVEALRYAVEYDGEAWHSSDEQRERDRRKRDYARDQLGWTVDVLTKADVFGRGASPIPVIQAGIREARLALGEPTADAWRWPDGSALRG